MTAPIELIRFARTGFVALLDGLSAKQLNHIPPGFNNNLIWNFGHVIAVQQALCYIRSGNDPAISPGLIETYRGGTAPTTPVSQDDIAMLKQLALSTVTQLEADLADQRFAAYQPFTLTADKLPVNSISDAIAFVAFHEALHLGYAQSLKRTLSLSAAA